jgi:dTDP-4-dehydrorhamnose reductase
MKVMVIGAPGQLGTEVCKVYGDCEVIAADVSEAPVAVDITDADGVFRLIAGELRPDLVINTAAAHNVPKCEEDPAVAYAVNATGARNVARACHACGARMLHISTDYVYGHGATQPLTEDDPPAPLSSYGASKLAGEHLIAAECPDHVIVRTSAIYGPAACRAKGGRNFVGLMLHLAESQGWAKVVTDEITSPTYTIPLAAQIRLLAEKGAPGLYHVTCGGACSWHEFARAIFDLCGVDAELREATTADFPSPVKRPRYSALDNKRLRDAGLDIMPPWREALASYLKLIGLA